MGTKDKNSTIALSKNLWTFQGNRTIGAPSDVPMNGHG